MAALASTGSPTLLVGSPADPTWDLASLRTGHGPVLAQGGTVPDNPALEVRRGRDRPQQPEHGTNSIAIGTGAVATGSIAVGAVASASNGGAAFGDSSVAIGANAAALGTGATATAANSVYQIVRAIDLVFTGI